MNGSLNLFHLLLGMLAALTRMKKVHHGAWAEGRTACGRNADVLDADHEIRLRGGSPGNHTGHAPVLSIPDYRSGKMRKAVP
jgi:hypothetical protein